MAILTQSLEHWLFENHKEKIPLIILGHLELFTKEMQDEYLAWCSTDEGKQYLKGGSKYDESHKGNIALDESKTYSNNFKTGDYARIVANVSDHEFDKGTIVKLERDDSGYRAYANGDFWWVEDRDLEKLEAGRC
jgi:hypothetical protein